MQTAAADDPGPHRDTAAARNEPQEQASAAEPPEQRDLFARARRRKLPAERKSVAYRCSVGAHEGYIIVGMYEEGTPGEIFIKMAKDGSTLSGFMDGVAVSIWMGLQYRVPLRVLVEKLTNTRFEPSGFTENPSIRHASSILDYIARWLGGKFISPGYLKPRVALSGNEQTEPATSEQSVNVEDREPIHRGDGSAKVADAPSCPTCGMLMVPNGSCYKCLNCGSTSGCS